jgi:enoyl-CoA hydratase/carnithine racemase
MSDSVAVEVRETDGGRSVAVVRIDRPPVSAIGGAMKERLLCVAAVRFALGGGYDLALSADFRISALDAK